MNLVADIGLINKLVLSVPWLVKNGVTKMHHYDNINLLISPVSATRFIKKQ